MCIYTVFINIYSYTIKLIWLTSNILLAHRNGEICAFFLGSSLGHWILSEVAWFLEHWRARDQHQQLLGRWGREFRG